MLTSTGKLLVRLGLHPTRGAFNHYRVLKALLQDSNDSFNSRELGMEARKVPLTRDDLLTLAHFNIRREPNADTRFSDSFSCFRRQGFIKYRGNYCYELSPLLKKLLQEYKKEATSGTESESEPVQIPLPYNNTDKKRYLYVTIKATRYSWLEQHLQSEDRYLIGGSEVSKEQYEAFLENNKDNGGLLALAKVVPHEFPLWDKRVPIVKVSETID